MMFITGSDELNKIDIVAFPKIYNMHTNIKNNDILLVTGKVEKRYDELQIIASDLEKLN